MVIQRGWICTQYDLLTSEVMSSVLFAMSSYITELEIVGERLWVFNPFCLSFLISIWSQVVIEKPD